jgi:hypothetical protein
VAERVHVSDQHTIIAAWLAQLRHDDRDRRGCDTGSWARRADAQTSPKPLAVPTPRRDWRWLAGRGASSAGTAPGHTAYDLPQSPAEEGPSATA